MCFSGKVLGITRMQLGNNFCNLHFFQIPVPWNFTGAVKLFNDTSRNEAELVSTNINRIQPISTFWIKFSIEFIKNLTTNHDIGEKPDPPSPLLVVGNIENVWNIIPSQEGLLLRLTKCVGRGKALRLTPCVCQPRTSSKKRVRTTRCHVCEELKTTNFKFQAGCFVGQDSAS